MRNASVLVVGAGPTGLTLALRLARGGVVPRIVDRAGGPGLASRAMAVQARTLEFYAQLGLAEAVVGRGIRIENARFREAGREVASVAWRDIGAGISPYPFVLSYAQDDHERFLVEQLAAAGVAVEWNVELKRFEERDGRVHAVLKSTGDAAGAGEERTVEAAYLCGCDGAHTVVRRQLGIDFPGGTYDQRFYVADVAVPEASDRDIVMNLGAESLVIMLPVRSSGHQRVIGVVPPALAERGDDLGFDDVRAGAEALLGIRTGACRWFSTYRVHHRVAERFRGGRAFIAGDAGHLHSPAGGQGMNTGIGDAVNLGWKLAHVLQGRAHESLLDSYEPERIAFARRLVATTDRAFQGLVGTGWASRVLREWVVPTLMPAASRSAIGRRTIFGTVSQTRIAYRQSPVSTGRAGDVHGGDRLPWTGDNHASLNGVDWCLHVYGGEAAASLSDAARRLGVAIYRYDWSEAAAAAGLQQGGVYLVRPDGHVGWAAPHADLDGLAAYAERIGLRAPSAAASARA